MANRTSAEFECVRELRFSPGFWCVMAIALADFGLDWTQNCCCIAEVDLCGFL